MQYLANEPDETLIMRMLDAQVGSEMHEKCKVLLDLRQKERFKTAYDLQATGAKKLVKVTWVLAIATWVLVVATILVTYVGLVLNRLVGH